MGTTGSAQIQILKGQITGPGYEEGIPGVAVTLFKTGNFVYDQDGGEEKNTKTGERKGYIDNAETVGQAVTDFDGNYLFKDIDPGYYSIRISSYEFQTIERDSVYVRRNMANVYDFELKYLEWELHDESPPPKKKIRKKIELDSVSHLSAIADCGSFPNSNLPQNKTDKNGMRQGLWRDYMEDGYAEGHFLDNEKHETWTYFDSEGQPLRREIFYKGQRIGTEEVSP
ncbi:MAG: hypothetical protein SchgKO_23280 [Schleiferiaceae bacterium]